MGFQRERETCGIPHDDQ